MASDLLERYELPFAWDASHRRLLIGAMDVSPTFREDGVQAEVGWPLFEMSLEQLCPRDSSTGPEPMGTGPILNSDLAF